MGKYQLKINDEIQTAEFNNYNDIQKYLNEQNINLSIDQIRRIKKDFYKREVKNKSYKRDKLLNYEIIKIQKST
jgi:hypothetical protein